MARTIPSTEAPQTSEALRNLSGYTSLEEVAQAAPADTAKVPAPEKTRKTRTKTTKPAEPNINEIAEKDERVNRFLNRMYGDHIGAIGTIPWEVWAWAANDPALALSDNEKTDWADGVYTLIRAMKIDATSPKFIMFSLLIMQLKYGMVRYAKKLREQGVEIPEAVSQFIEGK